MTSSPHLSIYYLPTYLHITPIHLLSVFLYMNSSATYLYQLSQKPSISFHQSHGATAVE